MIEVDSFSVWVSLLYLGPTSSASTSNAWHRHQTLDIGDMSLTLGSVLGTQQFWTIPLFEAHQFIFLSFVFQRTFHVQSSSQFFVTARHQNQVIWRDSRDQTSCYIKETFANPVPCPCPCLPSLWLLTLCNNFLTLLNAPVTSLYTIPCQMPSLNPQMPA